MIGQALYFEDKLKHTLLNPNQMRANSVIGEDVPRHLSHNNSLNSSQMKASEYLWNSMVVSLTSMFVNQVYMKFILALHYPLPMIAWSRTPIRPLLLQMRKPLKIPLLPKTMIGFCIPLLPHITGIPR